MFEYEKKDVIELIQRLLPEGSEILCLSLTGSRAFGWGGKYYDIDVKGVFAFKDWWETLHWGKRLYDINLEELYHAFTSIERKSWTFYEDLSRPFYLHPDFDYETMYTFCTAENVKQHMATIKMQQKRLEVWKNPRTALHCYRLLLVPLNFLRTGVIEIDVLKINEEFGYEELSAIAEAYKERRSYDVKWDNVYKDLDELMKMLESELEERKDMLDKERYKEWKKKTSLRFYGEEI